MKLQKQMIIRYFEKLLQYREIIFMIKTNDNLENNKWNRPTRGGHTEEPG